MARDKQNRVIAWFSGGITSAVACKLALEQYNNVEIVFLDTKNEDDDTYRFLKDCQKYYGQEIITLSNPKWESIQSVWLHYLSLNTAHGAICSTELKRAMREFYQNPETDYAQIFGFEYDKKEMKRHRNMRRNYPEINVTSPLIEGEHTKTDCVEIIENEWKIRVPDAYYLGFQNNNCLKTGCVKGGIGYWQKFKTVKPVEYWAMVKFERLLTTLKGKPVTICKDQSSGGGLVFLEPNSDYPTMKNIWMIKGRFKESLMECHGFCGTKN